METLKPVSAIFDCHQIKYRAYFEFELDHVSGTEWSPMMVEAFLLSSEGSTDSVDSLVLCTLEEPGRGMLFPAFRFRHLYLHSASTSIHSSANLNMFLTLSNSTGSRFTLRCPEDVQFQFWKHHIEILFPEKAESWSDVRSEEDQEYSSITRDTSCYSFSSKKDEILSQSYQGLNIINNPVMDQPPVPSLDHLKFSFSVSPQLDQFSSMPSLIDAPELKAFLVDDFDFSDNLRNSLIRPKSIVEDVDIVSLSDVSLVSGPDYEYETAHNFKSPPGQDLNTSFIIAEEEEEEEEMGPESEFPFDHNSTTAPSPALAGPIPIQTAVSGSSASSPSISNTLVSCFPTPPVDSDSSELEYKVPFLTSTSPISETSEEESLEKSTTFTETSPASLPKESSQMRKPSTSKRFVSVLKNFSDKIKARASPVPLESQFEMLDPFQRIPEETPVEEPQYFQTQVLSAPQQMSTYSGNLSRAEKVLSKISEEVFTEEDFRPHNVQHVNVSNTLVDPKTKFSVGASAVAVSPAVSQPSYSLSNSSNSIEKLLYYESYMEDTTYAEISHSSLFSLSSIGTAVDSVSNNETVKHGHSRNLSNGISLRSFRRDSSNGSLDATLTDNQPAKMHQRNTSSSSSSVASSTQRMNCSSDSQPSNIIMRVPLAMVSKWQSGSWASISDVPLSVIISATNAGGLISCYLPLTSNNSFNTIYEETASSSRSPLFELPLNTFTNVRKRTAYDVHVRQGSDVFLFRLRSSPIAVEFAKSVDLSRQKLAAQTMQSGGSMKSLALNMDSSRSSSTSSLASNTKGSGMTMLVPPLLSNRSNTASPVSTNTSKTSLASTTSNSSTINIKPSALSQDPPEVLMDNIRCRVFSHSTSNDRWADAGLARLQLMTVSKRNTWRQMTLFEPTTDNIMIDARLPQSCFAIAGSVCISISDPQTQQLKYLLRVRNPQEQSQLAKILLE